MKKFLFVLLFAVSLFASCCITAPQLSLDNNLFGWWADSSNYFIPRIGFSENGTVICTHRRKPVYKNGIWENDNDTLYLRYNCYYSGWKRCSLTVYYQINNDTLKILSDIFIKE